MKSENTYSSVLCIDCTSLLANGESENSDPRWDEQTALENLQPGRVTFGRLDDKDEDESEVIDYSEDECYGCGTRTGGGRHKVTIWES